MVKFDKICNYYSNNKMENLENKKKIVYNTLLDEVFGTENFETINTKQIQQTFNVFDKIYFNNYITRNIGNGVMIFEASDKLSKSAGQCVYIKNNKQCKYILTISSKVLMNLFSNEEKSFSAGGIECKNRLECFILVFEHELIHLIIYFACFELGEGKEKHTKTFKKMLYNIFGHTTYKHQFLLGDLERLKTRLNYLRNTIELGTIVTFKTKKGILRGHVIRINIKTYIVKSKKDIWKVPHLAIVRIIE